MKLIICPGAADPQDKEYIEGYNLLRQEAKKRKFTETIVLQYPGHKSLPEDSELSVETSISVIKSCFENQEKYKSNYIVLCRSYGCFPFIEVIKEIKTNYLKHAVLWGPSAYVDYYATAVKDFDATYNKALGKGCRISKDFFTNLYPIELSINEIDHIKFPIFITSGSIDKYYPKAFHCYLSALNTNKQIDFTLPIEGLDHFVPTYNEEYINLIFQGL